MALLLFLLLKRSIDITLETIKVCEGIPENLVVYLYRADTDCVLPHVLPFLDLIEEVFQGSLVDARILRSALRCKNI